MAEEGTSQFPAVAAVWSLYKVPLLLGVGSVLLILFSFLLLFRASQPITPIRFSAENSTLGLSDGPKPSLASLTVDIRGAVRSPGVYTLDYGSRVEDAITVAGGLAPDVDAYYVEKNVNRAQKLVDGAKLYFLRQGEMSASHNAAMEQGAPITSHNNGDILSGVTTININTASQSELEALPGIGPVTASKIIAGRPYQTLDELVAKKAVGPSVYDKIKNQLTL